MHFCGVWATAGLHSGWDVLGPWILYGFDPEESLRLFSGCDPGVPTSAPPSVSFSVSQHNCDSVGVAFLAEGCQEMRQYLGRGHVLS